MFRFFTAFCLTLLLLFGCQASRSTMSPADDEVPPPSVSLTIQQVKAPAPFVWWEAEQPAATNFPPADSNPFAPGNPTEGAVLSAGKWIGIDGNYRETPFLQYTIAVPQGGTYFFYSRKFWQHGPFRWRWDDQDWQAVGSKPQLLDEAPLRQFVVANWVSLGKVKLTAGKHTLRIELTQPEGAAAFDCFLLNGEIFQPHGQLKPDQRYTADLGDWFIFDPGVDKFATSPIDLRSLNETVAGEQGWIQVKDESFVHAKTGQPVRFWAVNSHMDIIHMNPALMPYTARFLAKRGVNMVRLHGKLWSEDIRKIEPQTLQQLFAFIAALKQEGIYTCLSIYFPLWLDLDQASGFAGYSGQHPFSLLFFNPEFQQIYYGWWRSLLTTPNPTTGKTLADDPAVAMVELVNEDSYLFWTFEPGKTIPAPQMEILSQQFGAWLTNRYGSLDQTFTTWGATPDSNRGDRPAVGQVGFLPLYDIFNQPDSRRAQDTATFLTQSQQQFFQEAIRQLRQEMNYKGLIYASNWVTADARILGPLDKYSNTVADFMDRHGYFSGPHDGANASFTLSQGDTYANRSALLFRSSEAEKEQSGQEHDFNLPIMDVRYNGLPSTITEVNWTLPNRFRADFPLLAAAYGLLQGTDGYFFFVMDRPWDQPLGKFTIASPVTLGQFPAIARLYRQGLLEPGQDVANIALNLTDLYALKGAPVIAPQNLDELRRQDRPQGQLEGGDRRTTIDPLAFLVGKVNLRFTNDAPSAQLGALADFIDRQAKTVRSSTGQLQWDYNKGLLTVNAPLVQGATGFLKTAGTLDLNDVTLRSEIDYGTILLVALDSQPLAQSRQMLLQVMSEEQNFGWQTTGHPQKTIQNTGTTPVIVRRLTGQVTVKAGQSGKLRVTPLDVNGYPIDKPMTTSQLSLQPETFYYLIERT